ncbi:hypothetical protein KW842_08840 [Duganella sp. sic0402]|uniref:hypothetical protein n=1 Tax=Duganella sp. sic0402 TaxID=2854786 RepID=UPI001C4544FB|nr:hypothetical protein [Duganella sp. sic0402]MBV7535870.1 hypothetical protein [Duganella sp. sic0402]
MKIVAKKVPEDGRELDAAAAVNLLLIRAVCKKFYYIALWESAPNFREENGAIMLPIHPAAVQPRRL